MLLQDYLPLTLPTGSIILSLKTKDHFFVLIFQLNNMKLCNYIYLYN